MHVAGLVLVGEIFVVGAGRAGPVRGFRREAIDGGGENAAEGGDVILPHLEADVGGKLVAIFPGERDFGLVVAAPDDDTGMIAQAAQLVSGFGGGVELPVVGAGLPIVAEHEVLPDHDAELVADVVELVGLVVAAAPVANHVHVGVDGGLQDLAVLLGGDAGGEAVEGNDVGALTEDRDAVDDELEGASPLVGIAAQDDGTKAGFGGSFVLELLAHLQLRIEFVNRLSPVSGGVPQ